MDYVNEGVLAPGSPTASDSTLSRLSQSPTPLHPSTILMLVPQSLQYFPILTKSQSRDAAASFSPTTAQRFFHEPIAAMLEPVPQPITALQTLVLQLLAPVLQPITQPLILVIANLIPTIPPTSIPELYPRIILPHKAEYFSRENLLADVKNYAENNGFAVTINSSRLIKVYLVCDRRTKYRNRYDLTKETRRRTKGS